MEISRFWANFGIATRYTWEPGLRLSLDGVPDIDIEKGIRRTKRDAGKRNSRISFARTCVRRELNLEIRFAVRETGRRRDDGDDIVVAVDVEGVSEERESEWPNHEIPNQPSRLFAALTASETSGLIIRSEKIKFRMLSWEIWATILIKYCLFSFFFHAFWDFERREEQIVLVNRCFKICWKASSPSILSNSSSNIWLPI